MAPPTHIEYCGSCLVRMLPLSAAGSCAERIESTMANNEWEDADDGTRRIFDLELDLP
jgi:hypothetical protein